MKLQPPDPPLTDGVVLLRLLVDGDLAAMAEACRDPEMQRWTMVPHPYGEAEARQWLSESAEAWASGEAASFAIADAADEAYLGGIGLRSGPWPVGEVGYGVAPWARGRGVATRALRLVSGWAMDELGLPRISLLAEPENLPSQRVAENAGYRREGLLRSYRELKGVRRDYVMYSLLAEDGSA
jgi:RimJ/RimL family protein N-acetyltransferase